MRQIATSGLTGAGPSGVKALTCLLEDGNWQVRLEAARRLAWTEAPAVEAITALKSLLDEPSLEVRERAELTLSKLKNDAAKAGVSPGLKTP